MTDPYGSVALNDAMSGYGRMVFLLDRPDPPGPGPRPGRRRPGPRVLRLAPDDQRRGDARRASNELIFLFVGLELVSIPTYLLLYLPRRTEATQEAATKYFFLSVFSSALLLFGLAYLYGMAGVSNLKALAT